MNSPLGDIRAGRSKHLGLEVVKHRCGDESPVFGSGYGESGSLLSTPLRGLYTLTLVSLAPNAQTLLSGIVSYPSTTKFSGTIQRRLAWPLHKDDTHDQMGCTSVLNFFGTFPSAAGSIVREPRRELYASEKSPERASNCSGSDRRKHAPLQPLKALPGTCVHLLFFEFLQGPSHIISVTMAIRRCLSGFRPPRPSERATARSSL